jgi:hypothetical protein
MPFAFDCSINAFCLSDAIDAFPHRGLVQTIVYSIGSSPGSGHYETETPPLFRAALSAQSQIATRQSQISSIIPLP